MEDRRKNVIRHILTRSTSTSSFFSNMEWKEIRLRGVEDYSIYEVIETGKNALEIILSNSNIIPINLEDIGDIYLKNMTSLILKEKEGNGVAMFCFDNFFENDLEDSSEFRFFPDFNDCSKNRVVVNGNWNDKEDREQHYDNKVFEGIDFTVRNRGFRIDATSDEAQIEGEKTTFLFKPVSRNTCITFPEDGSCDMRISDDKGNSIDIVGDFASRYAI